MSFGKKLLLRISLGFSLGIVVGLVLTILSGSPNADGSICLYDPAFAARVGNDVTALVIEILLFGLLGVVGMGGSVVYDIDSWSLIKATAVHSVITILVYIGIGLTLGWLGKGYGIWNVIQIGLFVFVYIMIWLIESLIYKKQIRDINRDVEELKKREKEE